MTEEDFIAAAGRGRLDRVYRYGDVAVAAGGDRGAAARAVGNAIRRTDFPCAPHFVPNDYRLTEDYRSVLGDGREAWIARLRADGIEVSEDGVVAEHHRGDPADLLPGLSHTTPSADAPRGDSLPQGRRGARGPAAGGATSGLQLGDRVEHRGIVVSPIFPRRAPRARYLSLAAAIPLGLRVVEVDESGAVPELLAVNPLDSDVLLYDGEELVGAKQNRILNVSVLLAAGSETRIPVSCVEAGRWSRRSAAFSSARHASYPELRRRKAERLAREPMARGAAQGAVWDDIAAKADRMGVSSSTGASADIFAGKEEEMAELRRAFPRQPGQCGALFALGSDRVCLDYVSRPDVFAELYPKLLDGYLLDALERLDGEPAPASSGGAFLAALGSADAHRRPSAALGNDLRLNGRSVLGSALEHRGEILQLSGFSTGEVSS